MSNPTDTFTIGTLAKAAGVNVETIRFYQRKGLLPEPERPYGSIRKYTDTDFARLRFIKSAQHLGFSLDEVAVLLRLEDGTHCFEARALAEEKLAGVRARLADLHKIESVLAQLVQGCSSTQGQVACPLIASLQGA